MPSLIAFRGPLTRGAASQAWRAVVFEDFIGLASMAPVWRSEGESRRNATGPVATRNAKLIDRQCATNGMRV